MPRRSVEAIFNEGGVTADAPLRERLRGIGIDLGAPEPTYPLAAMRRMFQLICEHHFGQLPRAEGMREVGRRWVAGFKHTPVGFVMRATAPLFGPDRTLLVLPHHVTTAQEHLKLEIVPVGRNRYRIVCDDPGADAHLLAGCVEELLRTCGLAQPVVEVAPRQVGLELEVHWS